MEACFSIGWLSMNSNVRLMKGCFSLETLFDIRVEVPAAMRETNQKSESMKTLP